MHISSREIILRFSAFLLATTIFGNQGIRAIKMNDVIFEYCFKYMVQPMNYSTPINPL